MNPLIIEAREDTPQVTFDKHKGLFEITGKSLPEDTVQFYSPILDWVQEYISSPNEETIITFKIEYFNSSSHKAITEMLDMLAELQTSGKTVKVNWHYLTEDIDMYESGLDLKDMSGLEFNFYTFNINSNQPV